MPGGIGYSWFEVGLTNAPYYPSFPDRHLFVAYPLVGNSTATVTEPIPTQPSLLVGDSSATVLTPGLAILTKDQRTIAIEL